MLSLEEPGERVHREYLYYILRTACDSTAMSKQKSKKKYNAQRIKREVSE